MDISNSQKKTVKKAKTKTLVAKENIKSYSGASKKSKVVNKYDAKDSIEITSVKKNGYVLVNNTNIDEWVDADDLCTEDEYNKRLQGSALLDIDNPDSEYTGKKVSLSSDDRKLLERLVMGEAGAEGYEGAALVAQCIRDTMVYKGYKSVAAVRKGCAYSGSISKEPNSTVKKAVSLIFDDGGYAVKHKIFYFYAYKWCKSSWHETQPFVIQYGGHRFFDSK